MKHDKDFYFVFGLDKDFGGSSLAIISAEEKKGKFSSNSD